MELCLTDARPSAASGAFLWHRYLQDSPKELGAKYRTFQAACEAGPIAAGQDPAQEAAPMGLSELPEAEQAEARRARSKFLADLSSVELFGGVAKLARQCLPHMRDVLSDGAELERTLGATVAASDALNALRVPEGAEGGKAAKKALQKQCEQCFMGVAASVRENSPLHLVFDSFLRKLLEETGCERAAPQQTVPLAAQARDEVASSAPQ